MRVFHEKLKWNLACSPVTACPPDDSLLSIETAKTRMRTIKMLCNQTNGETPMKKVILAISAVVAFSGVAQAQDYLHGQSGTTYQNIGNTTYGSNGSTSQQIGNTTYGSNGSTSQRIGNTTYNSDGSTSQQIGNTLYNSDGSTVQRIGNTTYGSDGTTCQKIGSQTYCN